MKHYTLQALDEGNITFLKIDRGHANKVWEFILGFAFLMSLIVIGYMAVIALS